MEFKKVQGMDLDAALEIEKLQKEVAIVSVKLLIIHILTLSGW